MRTRRHSIIAWILCMLIISAILFSMVLEFEHDCTGQDCAICTTIHNIQQTLQKLGDCLSRIHLALLLCPALFFLLSEGFLLAFASCNTLISKKVRLND